MDTVSPARELLIGALAGGFTEAVFYALDSAKVLMQVPAQVGPVGLPAGSPPLRQLFRGVLPSIAFGSVPSFGSFFLCYVPMKKALEDNLMPTSSGFVHTLAASSLAAVPSSLVAVPSDVVKKRLFSESSFSYRTAFVKLVKERGVSALFSGWRANLVRDVPFVVVKMSLYEGLSSWYMAEKRISVNRHPSAALNSTEASIVGFFSGVIAAALTTPTDCVNTRIKSGEFSGIGLVSAHVRIWTADGPRALFRGVIPRVVITGCGSTVFWFIYAELQSRL